MSCVREGTFAGSSPSGSPLSFFFLLGQRHFPGSSSRTPLDSLLLLPAAPPSAPTQLAYVLLPARRPPPRQRGPGLRAGQQVRIEVSDGRFFFSSAAPGRNRPSSFPTLSLVFPGFREREALENERSMPWTPLRREICRTMATTRALPIVVAVKRRREKKKQRWPLTSTKKKKPPPFKNKNSSNKKKTARPSSASPCAPTRWRRSSPRRVRRGENEVFLSGLFSALTKETKLKANFLPPSKINKKKRFLPRRRGTAGRALQNRELLRRDLQAGGEKGPRGGLKAAAAAASKGRRVVMRERELGKRFPLFLRRLFFFVSPPPSCCCACKNLTALLFYIELESDSRALHALVLCKERKENDPGKHKKRKGRRSFFSLSLAQRGVKPFFFSRLPREIGRSELAPPTILFRAIACAQSEAREQLPLLPPRSRRTG